jgi:hypothetical protein
MTSLSAALACEQARSTRALNGGRMNTFDTGHGFRAQAFESLLDGALNLLFRSFKVVEGRSKSVAESLPALTTAED